MKPSYKKGTICYVKDDPNHPPIGSETWANRMAVIISNNVNNKYSNTVLISFMTTKKKKAYPTHIPVKSGNRNAILMCEQIFCVDKSRLCSFAGCVSDEELKEIDKALLFSLQISNSLKPIGIFEKWENYIRKYKLDLQESDITDDQKDTLVKQTALMEQLITERNLYKELYETKMAQLEKVTKELNAITA